MTNRARRSFLRGGMATLAGMTSVPALLSMSGCQSTAALPLPALSIEPLTGKVSLVSGAPGNLLVLHGSDGALLVDSGSDAAARALRAALSDARVHTVFNTHYHADQTGGNALFGAAGADIHAHLVTRQWLSADYYVPGEDRWVKAPPAAARPTRTFRDGGEITTGGESIAYGYLLEAHTRGDIYVHLRDSNVLAVGDSASPLRDPVHDWYAGGWLGGRVDALDLLLSLANESTRIVPSYGPVMTRAGLQAERDLMLRIYERTTQLTTQGRSAQDMLDAGILDDLPRRFDDPARFLYDVCKGHWAHYTNFGGNIV